MELQSNGVTRGYFDLGDPDGGKPLTQRVRASRADAERAALTTPVDPEGSSR